MKKMNKKGFTLVELLAVIVILALIMAIAVVSMGGIMQSAREGTFKDTALSIINGVKQQLAVNGQLGETTGAYYYFPANMLEKGGKTSPLGGEIKYITDGATSVDGVDVTKIGSMLYKAEAGSTPGCDATKTSHVFADYDSSKKIFTYSICLTAGANNKYIEATEEQLLDTTTAASVIK